MSIIKQLLLLSLPVWALTRTGRFPSSINILFHEEIEKGIEKLKKATNVSRDVRVILIQGLKKLENANWRELVPEISYSLSERTRNKFSLLATQRAPPGLKPFEKSYSVALSFLKTVIKAGTTDEEKLGDLAYEICDALIKLDTEILSEATGKIVRETYHNALTIALTSAINGMPFSASETGTQEQSSIVKSPDPD